jgi:hypothetical protein
MPYGVSLFSIEFDDLRKLLNIQTKIREMKPPWVNKDVKKALFVKLIEEFKDRDSVTPLIFTSLAIESPVLEKIPKRIPNIKIPKTPKFAKDAPIQQTFGSDSLPQYSQAIIMAGGLS